MQMIDVYIIAAAVCLIPLLMLAVIGFALVGKLRNGEYTSDARLGTALTAPAPKAAVRTVVLIPMTLVIAIAVYHGYIGWRGFLALSVIALVFGLVVYKAAAKRHSDIGGHHLTTVSQDALQQDGMMSAGENGHRLAEWVSRNLLLARIIMGVVLLGIVAICVWRLVHDLQRGSLGVGFFMGAFAIVAMVSKKRSNPSADQ
jgi:hypothetical protein